MVSSKNLEMKSNRNLECLPTVGTSFYCVGFGRETTILLCVLVGFGTVGSQGTCNIRPHQHAVGEEHLPPQPSEEGALANRIERREGVNVGTLLPFEPEAQGLEASHVFYQSLAGHGSCWKAAKVLEEQRWELAAGCDMGPVASQACPYSGVMLAVLPEFIVTSAKMQNDITIQLCNSSHSTLAFTLSVFPTKLAHPPSRWSRHTTHSVLSCMQEIHRQQEEGLELQILGSALLLTETGYKGYAFQHFLQDTLWKLLFAWHLLSACSYDLIGSYSPILETFESAAVLQFLEILRSELGFEGAVSLSHGPVSAEQLLIVTTYPAPAYMSWAPPILMRQASRIFRNYVSRVLLHLTNSAESTSGSCWQGPWLFCPDSCQGCQVKVQHKKALTSSSEGKYRERMVLLSRVHPSRCQGSARCLQNQDDVIEALRWFASVGKGSQEWTRTHPEMSALNPNTIVVNPDAENWSLLEIASVMRQAALIVGPHGGQLYNIIFAMEGTRLVEIVPSGDGKGIPISVHRFSSSLGINDYLLAVPGRTHFQDSSGHPFVAKIPELLRILAQSFHLLPFELSHLIIGLEDAPQSNGTAAQSSQTIPNVTLRWKCSNLDLAQGRLCREHHNCLQVLIWINGKPLLGERPKEPTSSSGGLVSVHLPIGNHTVQLSIQVGLEPPQFLSDLLSQPLTIMVTPDGGVHATRWQSSTTEAPQVSSHP